MKPVRTAIIGCGKISGIYIQNLKTRFSRYLDIAVLSDLNQTRADERAHEYDIQEVRSTESILADPSIELVVNLTVPESHADINLRAIEAGKHVYVEKPFAVSMHEGRKVSEAAAQQKVYLGCAPDTFMGAGIGTCRRIIDEGRIGRPVGAAAFFTCPGYESWHPHPGFFYSYGGGPMLDRGPYYLTALVNLLGPVVSVSGMSSRAYPEREILTGPDTGDRFPVNVDTHVSGTLRFRNGVVGTVLMSFDVKNSELPRIEIYGTEGTLSVPDPNTFNGPVRLFHNGNWQDIALDEGVTDNARGIGAAELACSMRAGRVPLASGKLGLHVLESMLAFDRSSTDGSHIQIKSSADRPGRLDLSEVIV